MLIKATNIQKDDYDYIHARFFFPYPKATAQKRRIEGYPMRIKCDLDNLTKGLKDALEQGGIIEDDRQICAEFCEKYYTTGEPRIEFELEVFDESNYSFLENKKFIDEKVNNILTLVCDEYGVTPKGALTSTKMNASKRKDILIVVSYLLSDTLSMTVSQIAKRLGRDKGNISRYISGVNEYKDIIPHEKQKLEVIYMVKCKLEIIGNNG